MTVFQTVERSSTLLARTIQTVFVALSSKSSAQGQDVVFALLRNVYENLIKEVTIYACFVRGGKLVCFSGRDTHGHS